MAETLRQIVSNRYSTGQRKKTVFHQMSRLVVDGVCLCLPLRTYLVVDGVCLCLPLRTCLVVDGVSLCLYVPVLLLTV